MSYSNPPPTRFGLHIWKYSTDIGRNLESLNEFTFQHDRDYVRNVLNELSQSNRTAVIDQRYRIPEDTIFYDMANLTYLKIFGDIYAAFDSVDCDTHNSNCICNSNYQLALKNYTENVFQLRKAFYEGVGSYDRDAFEKLYNLRWSD